MFKLFQKPVVIFVILFVSTLYSQEKALDSLERIVQNPKVHDTTKLDALAGMLDFIFYLSPEARQCNRKLGVLAANNLRKEELDPVLRSTYLKYLATYYNNLGAFEESAQSTVYLERSIQISKSIGNYDEAHGTYILKAGNYAAIGDQYNAIQCLFKALKYFEQKKNHEQIPYIYFRLSNIYHNLDNERESIKYNIKALRHVKQESTDPDDAALSSTIHTNLGTSYLALKEYHQADFHFKEALKIAQKNKDSHSQGVILTKIGLVQQKLDNLELAFSLYRQAADLSNSPLSEANVQIRLGEYYWLTKKYPQAEKALRQAYDLSAQMGNQRFIQTTSELLHQVYQATGNYRKAYEMLLINNRIKDSSKVEISRNALVEKELKYDYEKKAWKHQLETQQKNNLLIGLSVAMLLLFLAGYFLYRNSKQKQRIAAFERNDLKQKLLLSQMNPHFVYNSIDNIKSLIYNKKDNQAVNYLTKFSKLMRQILEHSNENYIALDQEIALLENYLSIQQLLHNNKFEFSIDVASGIDTEAIYIPPMLTQPFIENAIKHGLRNKQTGGQIRSRFYLNEQQLFFEVIDNGKGIDSSQREDDHKSLGVAITRERLQNYTKNKNFALQIENVLSPEQEVVGAKIVFEIPYIYEN